MTKTLIDKSVYEQMDNKTLIKKQQEIQILISKSFSNSVSKDMIEDLTTIQKYIDAEIDNRLDDGRMDEDELDEEV